MRSNQATIRIEFFDNETPVQFSIYADSNNSHETLSKLLKATYDELSMSRKMDSYEDWIDSFKFVENTHGVCETYKDPGYMPIEYWKNQIIRK